jgi:hypothetical protein
MDYHFKVKKKKNSIFLFVLLTLTYDDVKLFSQDGIRVLFCLVEREIPEHSCSAYSKGFT